MKRLAIIFCLVIFVIAAIATLNIYQSRSFAKRLQSIRIGDSRERVEATLGKPTRKFFPQNSPNIFLGVWVETWAYGERLEKPRKCFHSEFPYFWPLKYRLFGPDPDDVVVEFDLGDSVSKISLPSTEPRDR